MIRFAAANRLLVEIDYRDKQGNRSTRAIEAYSLRRSQAGDVLLMAVRADSGQPRSYLVDSILGVKATQTSFTPRYPIDLTPSDPQSIPRTAKSSSGSAFGAGPHTDRSALTCTQIDPKHGFPPGSEWSNLRLQMHPLWKDLQ